jgi:hypothetical protein
LKEKISPELDLVFLDSGQELRKVSKELDFSPKYYFALKIFEVSAWLSNHTMCKIGLRNFDVALLFLQGLPPL